MLPFEKEHQFHVKGLTLKAKSWGDPSHPPVLALHGWLDNCHSFLPLAAFLEGIYLVAIDLAGHGQSDFRSLDSGYNAWQDVADVFEIADTLGFKQFSLLGHSRGAFITLLSGGTFPDRVKSMVLLDGFTPPEFVIPAQAPQQLARAIKTSRRFAAHKRKVHPDIDHAVKSRTTGVNEMSEQAARVLAERGMRQVEGGVIWSSDPRLQAASDFKLSKEHCQGFIDRIQCPVLLILAATPFSDFLAQSFNELAAMHEHFKKIKLVGNHHMHMEADNRQGIGETLTNFYLGFSDG